MLDLVLLLAISSYLTCNIVGFLFLTVFIDTIRHSFNEAPLDTDANGARLTYLCLFNLTAWVSLAGIVVMAGLSPPRPSPTKQQRGCNNPPCFFVVACSAVNAFAISLGVSAAAAAHFIWTWKNEFEASGQASLARYCDDTAWTMCTLAKITVAYLGAELLLFVYYISPSFKRCPRDEGLAEREEVQLRDIEAPVYITPIDRKALIV